ncbi:uncharacterized protein LOC119070510 isoform X2 [Bradysia coprophila]|uniref:uncharacterized protein LOC119070510 isoform X2 n=1 Tax=Bradysia coprophila TaxID=38358 RepID=UPI00187D78F6|nr:uncharacterized protein LOC119070510 isoform X2 [Bradysia coprophila]
MTSQQDTTKLLIEHVRVRRSLWDQARQNIPGIKTEHQKKWTEVAKLHGSPEEMKKKWQSLRASFLKILKRNSNNSRNQSRWPYYQDMLFLLQPDDAAPSTLASISKKIKTEKRQLEDTDDDVSSKPAAKKHRPSVDDNIQSNVPFVETNANEGLSLPVKDDNNSEQLGNGDLHHEPNGQNIPVENSIDENSTNHQGITTDGDYLFLLSFYEFLHEIPNGRKLPIRGAITNAIAEIIAHENGDARE